MRIGMILDAPFPPDYRVEKEALTLIKAGHPVVLFCVDYKKGFHETHHQGIQVVHYPMSRLTYKLSALAYTFPFYGWIMRKKIQHFFKSYKPEILHVHDMVIAETAMKVARKSGVRVVLDLHENRPASMREYKHLKKWPGKWMIDLKVWERKQRMLASVADRVIVVTERAKDDIVKETGKDPAHVIAVPNTSTLSFSKEPVVTEIASRMKDTFNLLYIGDTSLRRGTDDCIRALAKLKSRIPHVRLWMIGTSSAVAELHALTRALEVENYVYFEGWQPQKLFTSYIDGAHICLSPLKRNPHHDTTFANKLFQYMSMGKPVLVSDSTAQAELVEQEKCGLVYPAGNIEVLKEQIVRLHKDESLRNQLGANAKNAVEQRWNWEQTSKPLVFMYQSLSLNKANEI